jgi:hypothetical protein
MMGGEGGRRKREYQYWNCVTLLPVAMQIIQVYLTESCIFSISTFTGTENDFQYQYFTIKDAGHVLNFSNFFIHTYT